MARDTQSTSQYYFENGRFYGTYKRGQYLFPVDEEELDRLDMFHKIFQVTRTLNSSSNGLHQRHLPNDIDLRILDLGCGTGIWAIDMADLYPNAKITGVDLNYTQPEKIPSTVEFRRQDITESDWGLQTGSFDLIHIRTLAGSIPDWHAVYQNILRHAKPGSGLIEHVEIDFRPQCANGSRPIYFGHQRWADELYAAFDQAGQPLSFDCDPRVLLHEVGFVEIDHVAIEMPHHPWPQEHHRKAVGTWVQLGVSEGLNALTMAPLTRMRGYTKERVLALISQVQRELRIRSIRSFCTLHIWTARKPEPSEIDCETLMTDKIGSD